MVPHAEVDCIFLESPVWSVGRGGKKYGLSKKEFYKRVTDLESSENYFCCWYEFETRLYFSVKWKLNII